MIYKIAVILLTSVSLPIYYFYFYDNKPIRPPVLTNSSSGLLKGQLLTVLNQSIERYLGVPYAVPPVGSLRFTKPKPIEFQKDVIDATQPKYACVQGYSTTVGWVSVSEDCLTLNIWTQQRNDSTQLKAVMFWIHGGALNVGTIYQHLYDGSVLATHDIVFVSVNYRLGPLGFLYGGEESAPGNVGLFDQLLGLKWVRENIHLFGGDKNQITIFGESAGSWSVSAHLLSSLSKGLFKRAIMQSGAHMYNKDRAVLNKTEALRIAKSKAKDEGCTDDSKWLDCLRKVDANRFNLPNYIQTFPIDGTEFLPLSAQKAFNELKFNKDLDLMAGVNKDEGTLLFPYMTKSFFTLITTQTKEYIIEYLKLADSVYHNMNAENIAEFYLNNLNDTNAIKWRAIDMVGDFAIICPTYFFAKRYAQQSVPETNVYFYQLTHVMRPILPYIDLGVYHSAEIEFIFGSALLNPSSTSEENVEFSKEVIKLWTNFAKYGKPDSNWSQLIDTKTHSSVTQIKELNPKTPHKYIKNLFDKTCDGFWRDYFEN